LSGIYFHIPFCKKACHYCNFHFSTSLSKKDDMIHALIKEVELSGKKSSENNMFQEYPNQATYQRAQDPAIMVETIYFGGGTPSLLSGVEIKKILDAVHQNFSVDNNAEVTLEANPDDIHEINLKEWNASGINRMSIGVQSFIDKDLHWMNRVHNASQALQCINLVKDSGFLNFSVDLIYGTPGLHNDDWKKNIQTVIGLNVPHLSCYALTVEPGTALKKMITLKKREDVDEEKQSTQFLLMVDWLENAGYDHYEISNFARPGARSKHNSSYWQGKPYIGIGPSAHSFDGHTRRWNVSNNELYLKSIHENIVPSEHEVLSATQQLNEYIMTSIRTMEGLDLNFISKKFGKERSRKLQELTNKFQATGKTKMQNSKIILTKEGKLFADGIAADLFFEDKAKAGSR
jgi:oxygen-independent coproporphyrinogen III oxidase